MTKNKVSRTYSISQRACHKGEQNGLVGETAALSNEHASLATLIRYQEENTACYDACNRHKPSGNIRRLILCAVKARWKWKLLVTIDSTSVTC